MTATKNRYEVVTEKQAVKQGFKPITDGYSKEEYDLLDKMIAGLKGIRFLLVEAYDGIRVYRHESEIKVAKQERGYW